MKYNPHTLEAAYDIASRINYDTEDGSLEAAACPNCHERVFVVKGRSSDGYCMNPGCGYERSAAGSRGDLSRPS